MESIDKYTPTHPLLKQIVSSIVFWRKPATEIKPIVFLPNNLSGLGFTLSGALHVKKDVEFIKMPALGTRNTLNKPALVKTEGNFFNISVRFIVPNGIYIFTKTPMNVIYEDDALDLINIFNTNEIRDLAEKLSEINTDKQRLAIIESFLISKIVNSCPALLKEIIYFIHASNGSTNLIKVSKQFSVTERTINNYFNKYIGISPIAYINLIRFRSVINLTDKSNYIVLHNAFEAGYYDQSHFIKHFKKLSTVTPTKFFQLKDKDLLSDFYNF